MVEAVAPGRPRKSNRQALDTVADKKASAVKVLVEV